MPHYSKGRGKGRFQRKPKWKGFQNVEHMSQWLTRTRHDDPLWTKHFKEAAENYKGKKPYFHPRSIRAVSTNTPVRLAGTVLSELKRHRKGKDIGGGVSELIHWLGTEVLQVSGINSLKERVGMGYEHRKIPYDAQRFAKALNATYYAIHKRPASVEGLTRLPTYDTDRYSVWQQPDGQYLVTIHGTRDNWGDIKQDVGLAAGSEMKNAEVQNLFNKFDSEGVKYDVASHSLGTQYVMNATHKNANKLYMFNPASSPLMDTQYLSKQANDKAYTNFISPSDAVSEALWHHMDDTTVKNSYVSPFRYSQLAAHSIEQWYPDLKPAVEQDVVPNVVKSGTLIV